jgi:hypothetical protein
MDDDHVRGVHQPYPTPLWLVMILNVLMMMGIMSRMIPQAPLPAPYPIWPTAARL